MRFWFVVPNLVYRLSSNYFYASLCPTAEHSRAHKYQLQVGKGVWRDSCRRRVAQFVAARHWERKGVARVHQVLSALRAHLHIRLVWGWAILHSERNYRLQLCHVQGA